MKNTQNEKLSEHLMNVDDQILDNAYEIDTAEKLKQYVKKKNKGVKKPFCLNKSFGKAAAVAVCFILTIAAIFAFPALLNREGSGEEPFEEETQAKNTLPPFDSGKEGAVTINTLAKLNYYAAVRMIGSESKAAGLKMSSVTYGYIPLAMASAWESPEEPPEPEITVEEGETNKPGPLIPDAPVVGEDIYYYELDPDEPFYIDKVSMFRIELTDEGGFLASKLGLGQVEVVITENCIWGESLITFRNGENFYSCLTNGWSYDRETGNVHWDFSTHKYVEGFYIVKNLAKENYGFNVYMDAQGQVISFVCDESENGGNRVDKNVKVVSTTVVSNRGQSFTVAELEDYFNSGITPENTEAALPEGTVETSEESRTQGVKYE